MDFDGTESWNGGTECQWTVKGKDLVTVSPLRMFGGKEGYCVPEDIFRLVGVMHQHVVSADCEQQSTGAQKLSYERKG